MAWSLCRGEVRDQSVKDLAVFLAGSVRGVACVNDQLTLSPLTVMDLQLAVEVRNALDRFPSFRSRQMAVDVSEGVVRLSGIVDTEDERQQAGQTAESVRGVTAVHNNLVIKGVGFANYIVGAGCSSATYICQSGGRSGPHSLYMVDRGLIESAGCLILPIPNPYLSDCRHPLSSTGGSVRSLRLFASSTSLLT